MKSFVKTACAAVTALSVAALAVPSTAADPGLDLPWPFAVAGGQQDLGDRIETRVTDDGWVLHAQKLGETVNIAPPLDGAAGTGEAFGTVHGKVWIDGAGDPDLSGAWFSTGYQIGCGIDMSGGLDMELATVVGSSPSANAGIEGGPSVQVELPNVTGVNAGADATAAAEVGINGKVEAAPTVSTHLNPGGVTNVDLASFPVDPGYKRASGGFVGAHVQVNGCVGPISVRSYVTLSTMSPTSVDAVSVYGDPLRIR